MNGLSLIRKSISLRGAVIRVGSAPTRAGPIRSVIAATRALAGLAAPEGRDRGLAQADQSLVGVDPDDHVVRRDVIAVGRLGGHARASGTRTGIASICVIRMSTLPSLVRLSGQVPPAARSP